MRLQLGQLVERSKAFDADHSALQDSFAARDAERQQNDRCVDDVVRGEEIGCLTPAPTSCQNPWNR